MVFGKVMSGLDVVRKIEALNGTPPTKEVVITDSGEVEITEPIAEELEE